VPIFIKVLSYAFWGAEAIYDRHVAPFHHVYQVSRPHRRLVWFRRCFVAHRPTPSALLYGTTRSIDSAWTSVCLQRALIHLIGIRFDSGMNVLIGSVWRVGAFMALTLTNRDKQR